MTWPRRCERVHRLPAIDPYGHLLSLFGHHVQFTGVARGAGEIQKLFFQIRIEMLSESYGELLGIVGSGDVVDDESQRSHVAGIGEAVLAVGALQVQEPEVAQVDERSSLRRVVKTLPQCIGDRRSPALVEVDDL